MEQKCIGYERVQSAVSAASWKEKAQQMHDTISTVGESVFKQCFFAVASHGMQLREEAVGLQSFLAFAASSFGRFDTRGLCIVHNAVSTALPHPFDSAALSYEAFCTALHLIASLLYEDETDVVRFEHIKQNHLIRFRRNVLQEASRITDKTRLSEEYGAMYCAFRENVEYLFGMFCDGGVLRLKGFEKMLLEFCIVPDVVNASCAPRIYAAVHNAAIDTPLLLFHALSDVAVEGGNDSEHITNLSKVEHFMLSYFSLRHPLAVSLQFPDVDIHRPPPRPDITEMVPHTLQQGGGKCVLSGHNFDAYGLGTTVIVLDERGQRIGGMVSAEEVEGQVEVVLPGIVEVSGDSATLKSRVDEEDGAFAVTFFRTVPVRVVAFHCSEAAHRYCDFAVHSPQLNADIPYGEVQSAYSVVHYERLLGTELSRFLTNIFDICRAEEPLLSYPRFERDVLTHFDIPHDDAMARSIGLSLPQFVSILCTIALRIRSERVEICDVVMGWFAKDIYEVHLQQYRRHMKGRAGLSRGRYASFAPAVDTSTQPTQRRLSRTASDDEAPRSPPRSPRSGGLRLLRRASMVVDGIRNQAESPTSRESPKVRAASGDHRLDELTQILESLENVIEENAAASNRKSRDDVTVSAAVALQKERLQHNKQLEALRRSIAATKDDVDARKKDVARWEEIGKDCVRCLDEVRQWCHMFMSQVCEDEAERGSGGLHNQAASKKHLRNTVVLSDEYRKMIEKLSASVQERIRDNLKAKPRHDPDEDPINFTNLATAMYCLLRKEIYTNRVDDGGSNPGTPQQQQHTLPDMPTTLTIDLDAVSTGLANPTRKQDNESLSPGLVSRLKSQINVLSERLDIAQTGLDSTTKELAACQKEIAEASVDKFQTEMTLENKKSELKEAVAELHGLRSKTQSEARMVELSKSRLSSSKDFSHKIESRVHSMRRSPRPQRSQSRSELPTGLSDVSSGRSPSPSPRPRAGSTQWEKGASIRERKVLQKLRGALIDRKPNSAVSSLAGSRPGSFARKPSVIFKHDSGGTTPGRMQVAFCPNEQQVEWKGVQNTTEIASFTVQSKAFFKEANVCEGMKLLCINDKPNPTLQETQAIIAELCETDTMADCTFVCGENMSTVQIHVDMGDLENRVLVLQASSDGGVITTIVKERYYTAGLRVGMHLTEIAEKEGGCSASMPALAEVQTMMSQSDTICTFAHPVEVLADSDSDIAASILSHASPVPSPLSSPNRFSNNRNIRPILKKFREQIAALRALTTTILDQAKSISNDVTERVREYAFKCKERRSSLLLSDGEANTVIHHLMSDNEIKEAPEPKVPERDLRNSWLHNHAKNMLAKQAFTIEDIIDRDETLREQCALALLRCVWHRVCCRRVQGAMLPEHPSVVDTIVISDAVSRINKEEHSREILLEERKDCRSRLCALIMSHAKAAGLVLPRQRSVAFACSDNASAPHTPSAPSPTADPSINLASLKNWVSPHVQRKVSLSYESALTDLRAQVASLSTLAYQKSNAPTPSPAPESPQSPKKRRIHCVPTLRTLDTPLIEARGVCVDSPNGGTPVRSPMGGGVVMGSGECLGLVKTINEERKRMMEREKLKLVKRRIMIGPKGEGATPVATPVPSVAPTPTGWEVEGANILFLQSPSPQLTILDKASNDAEVSSAISDSDNEVENAARGEMLLQQLSGRKGFVAPRGKTRFKAPTRRNIDFKTPPVQFSSLSAVTGGQAKDAKHNSTHQAYQLLKAPQPPNPTTTTEKRTNAVTRTIRSQLRAKQKAVEEVDV